MDRKKSAQAYQKAKKHLVGGVNSPVRAFNSVGGDPVVIRNGNGPFIYDVDGNEYYDYVGSYGPLILGHNHPKVNEALHKALDNSTTFGATTPVEADIAELVNEAFPHMEKIRFVNSGTEAIMSTVRLARAFTGKNKIIKFAGCYHGHLDAMLVAAGSGMATQGIPSSEGVGESSIKDTLIAEYNDIESVEKLFQEFPDDIAAIALEPVTGNMGVVKPEDNFLKKLRELADKYDTLLVLDEVMTGFRYHFGGAQHVYNVEPDITCLGKVIGGGLPVGAYGGKEEIMSKVAPEGPVYQAGTLSGNPIAMTAGYHTLKILKENPELYQSTRELTAKLALAMQEIANSHSIPTKVHWYGSMINPFFTDREVHTYSDVQTCDTERFAKFFWGCMDAGIYIPPSQYETWFVPLIIDDKQLDQTLKGLDRAFASLKS